MKRFVLAAVTAGLLAGSVVPGAATTVPGTRCTLFPSDNAWHADVRALPVHPRSAAWLDAMGGSTRRLHPDFGPAGPGEQPYGIPYTVVDGSTPKVAVEFQYAGESDPGPYPLAADTPIEGGSDRHALIVDHDACRLYELFGVDWNAGRPTAGSGAIWDLGSNALRPDTSTSADAAGLSILAGLLRGDEILAGEVDHAIRITAVRTDRSYVWPARHQAGAASDPNLPPMGARFRLRGDFTLSGFRPDTKVVLRAMQRYGVIVADNGSDWYFTGTSEEGWDTDMLDELKSIPAGAFEAVDAASLMVDANSGQAKAAAGPTTTTAAPPVTSPPATSPAASTAKPKPATTTTAPAGPASTATTAAGKPATTSTSVTTVAPGPAIGMPPESPSTTTALPAAPLREAIRSTRSNDRSISLRVALILVTAMATGASGVVAWRRFRTRG